ncbi:MAG: hypothetical protein ACP5Q3_17050, partial [bacterium]
GRGEGEGNKCKYLIAPSNTLMILYVGQPLVGCPFRQGISACPTSFYLIFTLLSFPAQAHEGASAPF